jgi:carboxyl-terminal processing protease
MQDDEHKIGYIYISEFDTVTYSQFMSKLKELKEQGMKSLILDMRENPGGNVDTVCDIADELMPEGKIFFVRDKNGKSKEYNSDASRSFVGDMVVLVDNNSASAAEILTGALKDHKLATVVGVKTFGKGIVQSLYPLGDGTAVKLTVEDYFTAGGHNIHKVGIAPDVEVELDRDAYKESGYDNQLEKAVELLGGTYVNDRSVSGNDAEAAPGDGER